MTNRISDQSVGDFEPDYTAICTLATLRMRALSAPSPSMDSGLDELANALDSDSDLMPDGRETLGLSFALLALSEGNSSGRYDRQIRSTIRRIEQLQWTPRRKCQQDDFRFGGVGYRRVSAPDLYHTALAIQALRQAGVPSNSPFMKRAVVFFTRCQRLDCERSASVSRNSGGFVIDPFTGRTEHPCGGLTCAGIKGLILCGVPPTDRRIKSAAAWLSQNYTLSENPGIGDPKSRLYDYYWSFATAMNLLGRETIVDANQIDHEWRTELIDAIRLRQQADGSWANPDESEHLRETMPFFTTSLALLTLAETLADRPDLTSSSNP
ncbi:prenyltransferase/squalene oxidase repeat-containing protein [Stieleria maiorica]|uniref:prenyltransferase/squalene oxidase repeat-containing protein n=1 Tax=Stieleria maiorica TaxID=2795974 RepID=UPI0011CB1EF1|nr:prenyltransferase/squalene oxidase repeat-containing protein [Stieleria maiorica]